MKVYDIINEGGGKLFLGILEKIAAPEIDKALAYLARLSITEKMTAKEIAQSWSKAAEKTGLALEDVIVMGEREMATAGVDRALIDSAVKEAASYKPGLLGRIAEKLKSTRSKTATVKTAFGDFLDITSSVLYKLAVWEPVLETTYNIGVEYLDYKAGKMTESQFRNSAQYWLNDGVGKVAAALIGNATLAIGFGAIGGVGLGSWKPLAGLAQFGNQVSQTALNAWLLTPHGRDALAKLIMGDTFGHITGPNGEQIPALKFIRDAAGGWITEGTKRVTEAVQEYTDPAAAAEAKRKRDEKDAKSAAELTKLPRYTPGMEIDQRGMSVKSGPDIRP
jgi:hypothetical protein